MRFLLKNLDQVLDYIAANRLSLFACDILGGSVYQASPDVLVSYFETSRDPLADDARLFFIICRDELTAPIGDLREAVRLVEAPSAQDMALLYEYADGGLISVSQNLLPFQSEGAESAEWWRLDDAELVATGPQALRFPFWTGVLRRLRLKA